MLKNSDLELLLILIGTLENKVFNAFSVKTTELEFGL